MDSFPCEPSKYIFINPQLPEDMQCETKSDQNTDNQNFNNNNKNNMNKAQNVYNTTLIEKVEFNDSEVRLNEFSGASIKSVESGDVFVTTKRIGSRAKSREKEKHISHSRFVSFIILIYILLKLNILHTHCKTK